MMLLKENWGPTWEARICPVCPRIGWDHPEDQSKHPLETKNP